MLSTEKTYCEADIAKSLLISVSNDVGQIAVLHANLYNLKNIYFGGYFIRGHPMTMHTISFAVNFWSKVNFIFVSDQQICSVKWEMLLAIIFGGFENITIWQGFNLEILLEESGWGLYYCNY